MDKLLLKITEDMKKYNITKRMICEGLPITEQSLGKNLNGKTSFSFMNFIATIDFVYKRHPALRYERLKEFFRVYEKPPINFKTMFEWAANNSEDELSDILIRRLKDDNQYREMARMYNLLKKRKLTSYKPEDFLEDFNCIDLGYESVKESSVLKIILNMYNLWDSKGYSVIPMHAKIALRKLEDIPESYTKTSYKFRILEMNLGSLVKRDENINTRQIEEEIGHEENFDLYPLPINSIFIKLAEYYGSKDFEKSKYYMQKAIDTGKTFINKMPKRKKAIESTHDHIYIKNNDYSNLFLTDEAEKAHYYARTGNAFEAIPILDELERVQGRLTAFQKYYKALALDNNLDLMKESFDAFIYEGDLLYARLPSKHIR